MIINKKHTLINKTSNSYRKIKYIVIHDTGVNNQTAKNNADYFYSNFRNASADYFVDDNEIWETNNYKTSYSWHVGDGYGKYGITNENSIGIEMCPKNSKITKETIYLTIKLVKKLQKDLNISNKNVVRHYDASRKNCPQFLNNDGKWTDWHKFKKLLETKTNTKKEFDINNYNTKLYKKIEMIKGDYSYNEKSLKTKKTKHKKGKVLNVKEITYSGKYPRYVLTDNTYITTRKDTVKEHVPIKKASWVKENGNFKMDRAINIRTSANEKSSLIATLPKNSIVKYDAFLIDKDGYVWIRQKRGSKYGYLATGQSKNGKRVNYWGKFY